MKIAVSEEVEEIVVMEKKSEQEVTTKLTVSTSSTMTYSRA